MCFLQEKTEGKECIEAAVERKSMQKEMRGKKCFFKGCLSGNADASPEETAQWHIAT